MRKTNEGAMAYEHSLNHALEFFSKAGSLFTKSKSFYGNDESALSLFQKSWIVDEEITFRILLWLRDCRGGAGNRSGARECLHWVANHKPDWVAANIGWIPLVGRWDDLRAFFGTPAEKFAVELWVMALKKGDVLAAKWADRNDKPLRKALGMSIGDFRRFLAKLRSPHIVEHKMCQKNWDEINYEQVPSVAMARYTKAFGRNDEVRFQAYKEALQSGKVEIKAGVLFPHDCVRTAYYGDPKIADAQFEALPNFMEGTDENIVVISDTSLSMSEVIAGEIRAVDVSQGLALYCSSRLPKDSPFYKKFIGFCSEGRFKNWDGMSFSEAVKNRRIFDGAIGSTRIDTALMLLLKTAQHFKIEQELMPTTLLIVSDMQFHKGMETPFGLTGCTTEATEVEKCMKEYDRAGYKRPKIVYWNTDGYGGAQATAYHKDVAMVSGFSTGILKAILSGDDFSPIAVMMRAIEKYEVTRP